MEETELTEVPGGHFSQHCIHNVFGMTFLQMESHSTAFCLVQYKLVTQLVMNTNDQLTLAIEVLLFYYRLVRHGLQFRHVSNIGLYESVRQKSVTQYTLTRDIIHVIPVKFVTDFTGPGIVVSCGNNWRASLY